ncbi:MAG: hypothetical protein ACR2NZ_08275, partial [Rubripirellula sp.]
MTTAFEASASRFSPTLVDHDWKNIQTHRGVAYVLSPPMSPSDAESISAQSLLLLAKLLNGGGVAAKSESAGLAHGKSCWLSLAERYSEARRKGDDHAAAAALYWAWTQRLIHDESTATYYSVGMHLLGQRDTEIEDRLDVADALEWIDMLGLYLVADKPSRPLLDGE